MQMLIAIYSEGAQVDAKASTDQLIDIYIYVTYEFC